ncbi:Calx-beta domain-containing protein, partial [Arcobacter sp. YIC-464]|uniref:Calx-beta domain-containing protein n=1 Tax=Arcobacter sp. YIC-464 TaxID=3376631 RepID=UPI003C2FA2FE
MKLTIKTGTQLKEIDLNKNLSFNVNKGEQYVFSNGFTNYVLNFKDDQESILLIFNVEGKTFQVELNGIVPLLQDNTNTENPTAIIINKNVNNKDIEDTLDSTAFNGSEILDRLEQLASLGVDAEPSNNLALISDFQTLIESLDAAAAGADAGETTSDGSTFNSILNPTNDSLPGIAETDRWENLSESISSTPVDTANDPLLPDVSISDATVNENEGSITFVITLSEASNSPVRVTLETQEGTAKEVSDFIATSGDIVFLPGETTLTFSIPVVNDNIYEVSENLFLNITNATNANIIDSQGEGTILDSDIPTVSITGSEVIEGEYAIFDISLTSASLEDIILNIETQEGTATEADYIPTTEVLINGQWVPSSNVTIPAGEDNIQVRVKTNDDVYKEPTETFSLKGTVISGATTNTTASGLSYIADELNEKDNVNVKLEAVDTEVIEGETATYKVTLTDDAGQQVVTAEDLTVDFTYTYKTADGDDITETVSVTIPKGSSEAPVEVVTVDDNLAEGSETFDISLKSVTAGEDQFEKVTINQDAVETTITDESVPTNPDDQTALVSIEGPSNVTEGDVTTPYTVSITQAPETDLEVFFTYTGVAEDGTDFTGVSSVIIKAGDTSATFTIATLDDNLAEGSENFTVSIDSTKLGAVGGLEDVRVDTTKDAVETTIT